MREKVGFNATREIDKYIVYMCVCVLEGIRKEDLN